MNALTFDGVALPLIEHDGRLWLKSADIAAALGYTRTDKLTQVYDRHKAEFSASMSRTLTLGHWNVPVEYRVFSLRGAHLLGMFARTAKGASFRRWVLDQLEAMEGEHQANRSLIAEFYQASAELDNQEKFASRCGHGLNDHKTRKPPLKLRLDSIKERMQPSLAFF